MLNPCRLCAVLCLTVCLFTGCPAPRESQLPATSGISTAETPAPSEPLPGSAASSSGDAVSEIQVELRDFDGLEESVKQHAGKVVVVDIWSNACLPCLREFPNLVELSRKYPEQVVCISMNVDYIGIKSKPPESYLPAVEQFLSKQQAENVINFAAAEADSSILEKYEIDSMPAIILYDADGTLVQKFTDSNSGEDGLTYAGDVIPRVEQLLR